MEARGLEPGQVERGVDRARGDGVRSVRVVVGGAHRHDPLPVAVGGLEDGAGVSAQDLTAPEPVQS